MDLNLLLQLILTAFLFASGLLYLVKKTASKYFEVDANFDRNHQSYAAIPAVEMESDSCAACGQPANKKCSRCKSVRYCSSTCQSSHWRSGHKTKCKEYSALNSTPSVRIDVRSKGSGTGGKTFSTVALVPARGTSKVAGKLRKVLFPYDEFVKFFNWDKPGFLPCGLLNCGNSCFANVVLQCLLFTRPLVAYLLEKGHRRECRRNDWCFLCEFQTLVERASQSPQPFSPINILSRLTNIGGSLGYGRQEDAHEFMRFAIDTMQSVCLDEFGGEKAIPSSSQETTLIQHTFGGHLQSQVICTNCNKISNQYENMMDLTVEIHGDAASLEECLDQFTAKEWLHGDNMYKCDGCNDYVKAWKRLTIQCAPNILTIALKRFQSGRFGKLNKRVSFPETLDLSPYMSEEGDGTDVYRLYAVVVHVDMLNASFFGHYICYTKDFRGNWYRIDDSKVVDVELDEVLSQGAYMLLYSRVHARPSCRTTNEPLQQEQKGEKMIECHQNENIESFCNVGSINTAKSSCSLSSNGSSYSEETGSRKESLEIDCQPVREHFENGSALVGILAGENDSHFRVCSETASCLEDVDIINSETIVGINAASVIEHIEGTEGVKIESNSSARMEISDVEYDASHINCDAAGNPEHVDMVNSQSRSTKLKDVSRYEGLAKEKNSEGRGEVDSGPCSPLPEMAWDCEKDSSIGVGSEDAIKDSKDIDMVNHESYSSMAENEENCNKPCLLQVQSRTSGKLQNLKRESPFGNSEFRHGIGTKRAEIINEEVL